MLQQRCHHSSQYRTSAPYISPEKSDVLSGSSRVLPSCETIMPLITDFSNAIQRVERLSRQKDRGDEIRNSHELLLSPHQNLKQKGTTWTKEPLLCNTGAHAHRQYWRAFWCSPYFIAELPLENLSFLRSSQWKFWQTQICLLPFVRNRIWNL